MKRNFKGLLLIFSLFSIFIVQSCNDDAESIKPGADGFFVVNEGSFGNSNTSISFFDQTTGEMTNDVFAAKNGRPLGDQAQSMAVFEDKGYIIVQNSGKIEVIDVDDFSSIATIDDDLESPRYFLGISSTKAYVSDWGSDGITGTVKVIDLSTNTVTKTISTGQGTNRMIKVGNFAYVTNAGGYGVDNTVKVIDTNSDAVTTTLTVGDNPNSLVSDNNGNIWVTSAGALAYNEDYSIDEENSTKGSLSKITSSNTEELRLNVENVSYSGMANLTISPDGKTLYYTFDGNIYSMSTSSNALPSAPFKAKDYYGIAVNPFNGNIIGCLAPNFSSAGSIEVLDASGNVLNNYVVGIAPNGCAFK